MNYKKIKEVEEPAIKTFELVVSARKASLRRIPRIFTDLQESFPTLLVFL